MEVCHKRTAAYEQFTWGALMRKENVNNLNLSVALGKIKTAWH